MSTASSGLPGAIGLAGALGALFWLVHRFGPALLRLAGFCSWWIAWACGSEGGFAYSAGFLVFGALAWSAGTLWYAARRGRWPSALSGRILTRVLGRHSPLASSVPSVGLRSLRER